MILFLGADSMIAKALMLEAQRRGLPFQGVSHSQCDIYDDLAIRRWLKTSPSMVINCAGVTDVDRCERDPDLAYRVNGYAVGKLALICKQKNIRFVHFSSEYVFDGFSSVMYRETSPTNPMQIFGKSKLLGESLAIEHGAQVFRLGWVYGVGVKRQMLVRWINSLLQKVPIHIVADQIGSPCSADFVAQTVFELLEKKTPNLVQITHDNYSSSLKIAEFVTSMLALTPDYITVGPYNPALAFRPRWCAMDNALAVNAIGHNLGSWQDDLERFIKNAKLI